MYAIKAVYDGGTFQAQESIPVAQAYDVVITFVKPRQTRDTDDADTQERLDVVESLFGVLPPTVTDEEVREERVSRYALPR